MGKHLNYFEVKWKNFKSYEDTGWIKIKPLTILLGPNNSGKSNFTAPFKLMSQTVSSKDSDSALILNGDLYDGGSIKEIINNYDINKNIFFGFRYHVHEPDKKLKKIGSYAPGGIEITLGVRNSKKDNEDIDIVIKRESVYDYNLQEMYSLSLNDRDRYVYSGLGYKEMNEFEKNAIAKSELINFLFTPDTILFSMTNQDDEKRVRENKIYSKGLTEFLNASAYNYSRVRGYLSGLSYIGPSRENPHRIYEITNASDNSVGLKGQNMTSLLKKNLSSIHKELNRWVKAFEFGDSIELRHLYSNSYSILFHKQNNKIYTSMPNIGFGASQVLPLIIQALITPQSNFTIVEEPEIHLNPKLQCLLGDLLVYMANQKQRVIVETHSEHLLLRVRRLVANKTISQDDVAIYFIEKENDKSTIREIPLGKNGQINPIEWPKGFFGETLRESLALATAQANSKN